MTQAQPATNTAQYYRSGLEHYKRRHFLDALVMLGQARKLAPDNAEYQAAYERIQVLAASLGGWFFQKANRPQPQP